MASPRCPHCKSAGFELKEVSLVGAKYKMFFAQCVSCGAPVGLTDYYNIGSLVKDQEDALKKMDARIKRIENMTVQIGNALNQIIAKIR